MKKILCLYTKSYPFGYGESFLENEIVFLSAHYSKVFIFPLKSLDSCRELPSNCIVVDLPPNNLSNVSLFFKNIFLFFSLYIYETVKEKKWSHYIAQFFYFKSVLIQQFSRAEKLQKFIFENSLQNQIHYSYWTEDWALSLSILKKKKIINALVSRVHGYDLFLERRLNGIIPFRNVQIKYIDKIVAVSNFSLEYLKQKYPQNQDKFKLSRLGIADNGYNKITQDQEFSLVSCSNLIPLKRVMLIPDILRKITFPLTWFVIGDGVLRNELENACKSLPSNINVCFLGRLSNSEVINFYKNNSVNLFIHLSETEGGIPVSIQEAASFGIPILSSNAGGAPEIVNNYTGILLGTYFTVEEVASKITSFRNSDLNMEEFRRGVRTFALENFRADNTYKHFINEILEA